MQQTISIIVSGKVQGVYYRQSTSEKARELGLTGYVQNRGDHTVFILATGSTDQLEALLNWCRVGPPRARVESVESTLQPLQSFDDFRVRRTHEE